MNLIGLPSSRSIHFSRKRGKYVNIVTPSFAFVALVSVSSATLAQDRPTVPATAKKLTGAEIEAVYDTHMGNFDNLTNPGVKLTGRSWMDFKTKTIMGFYNWDGKDQGMFAGTIRIKGDDFCYKPGKEKETCVSVHRDGGNFWEADKKGLVTSANTMVPKVVPALPPGLKPASADEFSAFTKGKTFEVVVYSGESMVLTESVWNTKKKTVSGKWAQGGKLKGKFSLPITLEDGLLCAKQKKATSCHAIYIDGNALYEVKEDGAMHAVATAR